jgi:O-antigen/teichoic acid export membrane protein
VANLAQVGTRLVTVPIVIHSLGLAGYGIWNTIMMTASYMRFGSVGVKTAFQKYVAEAVGDGDYLRANKLLSTGCAIMLVLSIAGLIPVTLFSHSIARMAGIPPEFLQSAAGAISLLALIFGMANAGAAFESTVMGAHRIDLVRKCSTVLSVAEAIAIVISLHFGYGLFAMAAVMGTSELLYIVFCYFAARRVLPQIHVSPKYLSKDVLYELFRFAGSYQLLNLLEVLYLSLTPVAILRVFGADLAGGYAVVTRVVTSAMMLQEAFFPPILSGGTTVFASGSAEKMQALLKKAFKVTLGLSLFPLGFVAVFGTTLLLAWTGESNAAFRYTLWIVCLTGLFKSLSLLALVLYRVSGKAILDNIRQVQRILMTVVIIVFASKLGYYGFLGGIAVTELMGLLFMVFALTRTFRLFRATSLVPDAIRVTAATALIIGTGVLASYIPLPGDFGERTVALFKLAEVGVACLLVMWPLAIGTGSISSAEGAALFGAFRSRRNTAGSIPQTASE